MAFYILGHDGREGPFHGYILKTALYTQVSAFDPRVSAFSSLQIAKDGKVSKRAKTKEGPLFAF